MALFKRDKSSYQISSIKLTRTPVFHRFWGAAILCGLFFGFPFGSWVWAVLSGIVDMPSQYETIKTAHASIQVFVFFGLLIAGFALQSGAHVLAGSPPKSEQVIWIYPLILLGVVFKIVPSTYLQILGNLIISVGNLWLLYVMVRTALGGDRSRLVPIGSLFFIGFLIMAAAPWLDLANADQSFFVLWSGVFLIILAAGQQLIANVLSAKRFDQLDASIFAVTAFSSVISLGFTVFTDHQFPELTGVLMALTIIFYLAFLGVIPALKKTGFTSLVIAFIFNFGWALIIALALIFSDPTWDAILHILALGCVTTMIIAVAARVLGFFSGKVALSESALTVLIIAWQLVPILRGGGDLFTLGAVATGFAIFWLEILFSLWAVLCFLRVLKVMNPDKKEG